MEIEKKIYWTDEVKIRIEGVSKCHNNINRKINL